MNPYQQFTSEIAELVRRASDYPLAQFEVAPRPKPPANAPAVLFFAPHPDDECITAGAALRLLRESGMRAVNVAVTQGSKPERQAGRFQELTAACRNLGFELVATGPHGLARVNPKTREQDPPHWQACVRVIADVLAQHRPRVVMCPHDRDWNSTHVGTHYLVVDALAQMPPDFECFVFESEFWGQMTDPNLMLELSTEDLSDMITALTFHVGELARNPYHRLLPAWMMDNVRRGAELVGGQGGAAPDYLFAVLYRLRKWSGGRLTRFYEGGQQVPASVNLSTILS